MKKILTYALIAGGAFFVWQWFLSRRSPALYAHFKSQEQDQQRGVASTNSAIDNVPAMAQFNPWATLVNFSANLLESQVSKDGQAIVGRKVEPDEAPYNPTYFGFNQNN